MNFAIELVRLSEFVREIHGYYKLNKLALPEQLVVSKAMVSFALDDLDGKELDVFIEMLKAEGLIRTSNDQLIFPASFIEVYC